MWYLVVSKSDQPREQVQPYANEHTAWIKDGHNSGTVIFSGPAGEGNVGIWVLRANSMDAAKQLADSHPYHKRGLRSYEIYQWTIHQFMGEGAFGRDAISALINERANPA